MATTPNDAPTPGDGGVPMNTVLPVAVADAGDCTGVKTPLKI